MVAETLPRWDLTPFFPGLDGPEFESALTSVKGKIADFERAVSSGNLDACLDVLNPLYEEVGILGGYVSMRVSTNTRDERAIARESEIDGIYVELNKAQTKFLQWVGTLDIEAEILKGGQAATHAYTLRRAKYRSSKLMSPAEEELAAELGPSGATAWSKLHSAVSSQVAVTIGSETIPMSSARNRAYSADREVRRAAYEAELATWQTVEVPIAASMNGIKGQVNVLSRRRGWGEAIDDAVFENGIDRQTLDAMLGAARESFPDFRRYLKAKAKALGLDALEWYDLFAPLEGGSQWDYRKGSDFVAQQFDSFSEKMGTFARLAFDSNWIDWPPMPGKVDGAYCMPMGNVSRVLMNYDGTFGNVKTLAHELGHAYHTLCLADATPLNRETPSTLAETASIFCETIVKNAVLANTQGQERLAMLEACIVAPCQTVVDITSRYLFESRVFGARKDRDLSASEMCEIMLQAQKETYGDGLASYHPYMWAAKPHYYSVYSFYNFPYMFGLLFALGLYSLFKADPESFRARYDALLGSTGQADAHELGQRFGFDTHSVEFWRGSLNVVRADIDAFCAEVG